MNNRSVLYVPANRKEFIAKAMTYNPDVITLDLEDSVPFSEKQNGRELVRSNLKQIISFGNKISIRVNSFLSGLTDLDLQYVVCEGVSEICLPKCRTVEEVIELDNKLLALERERGIECGSIKIQLIIENAEALMNVYKLVQASRRLSVLSFGVVDYTRDLNIFINQPNGDEQVFARNMVVCAANAVKVIPIDCPYMNHKDEGGFIKDTEYSASIGFKGRILIHPAQIELANKLYSQSKRRIEWAKEIIKVYETDGLSQGRGSISHNGHLIANAVYVKAKEILERENAE